jgi:hypothetical protein
VDGDLVIACQKKVRTLVTRIGKRLQLAVSNEDDCLSALVQLVAVLAVIRELRGMDHRAQWVGIGETLVPIKERRRLLNTVCSYLFGRNHQLLNAITVKLDGEHADEISRLDGLLLWLAWDCGVSLDRQSDWGETEQESTERLLDRARLVALAPRVERDPVACDEAKGTILRLTSGSNKRRASEWLECNLELGRRMREYRISQKNVDDTDTKLQPGDIAYTPASTDMTPRIVLRNTGKAIWLSNLDESEKVLKFTADRVVRFVS